MEVRKATSNQAQPTNVSCKIVDKSHFLPKQKKIILPGLGNPERTQW